MKFVVALKRTPVCVWKKEIHSNLQLFYTVISKMGGLKLKNNKAISELNQAIQKARTDLYKAVEIYGLGSNEVVIASQNLDTYINISMKENF
ncbi:Spo0E like sporulation regulatory protein [Clostridium saccharoperbutylacetonicum N1-4(HMT)]|uniref:Spo0E like sporulation regulatory protein n=1 Tax=Clostridium saccharoperbutylacetonicum N1-4(HMT) TaxID=931276 RepID=M1MNF6_9CLOT|nr:Spo0E like sporulation regulatory protein [Clostridium saccharoperbutylacetonicum N1-4(HMT)]